MLYGMIDIGSNTVRMAIYFIEGTHVEMLMKKKHTVGLAAYLKDGVMQQQGIDKTVEILTEFKSFLMNFNITHVVAFTTAALRNARTARLLSVRSSVARGCPSASSRAMKKQPTISSVRRTA